MSLTLHQSIVKSINETLIDDHQKFLKSIYIKYGELGNFSLEYLENKYRINNILIVPNQNQNQNLNYIPKNKKIIKTIKNIDRRFRCMARCWGGEKSVKYDHNDNTWSYGHQCKRRKQTDIDYCGIHQAEIDKGYLTHGRIDGDVPHPHYNKYKIKIEIKNTIMKNNLNPYNQ